MNPSLFRSWSSPHCLVGSLFRAPVVQPQQDRRCNPRQVVLCADAERIYDRAKPIGYDLVLYCLLLDGMDDAVNETHVEARIDCCGSDPCDCVRGRIHGHLVSGWRRFLRPLAAMPLVGVDVFFNDRRDVSGRLRFLPLSFSFRIDTRSSAHGGVLSSSTRICLFSQVLEPREAYSVFVPGLDRLPVFARRGAEVAVVGLARRDLTLRNCFGERWRRDTMHWMESSLPLVRAPFLLIFAGTR